jgi:hypothetical protein
MEKDMPMKFSLVPLLVANKDISAEARKALVENRLRDAAVILMEQNGLTCVEAGQLLDVSALVCDRMSLLGNPNDAAKLAFSETEAQKT